MIISKINYKYQAYYYIFVLLLYLLFFIYSFFTLFAYPFLSRSPNTPELNNSILTYLLALLYCETNSNFSCIFNYDILTPIVY